MLQLEKIEQGGQVWKKRKPTIAERKEESRKENPWTEEARENPESYREYKKTEDKFRKHG